MRRDKAAKADAGNAVTNGPYWAGAGPDGNTVFRMRVRIGITCARAVLAWRVARILRRYVHGYGACVFGMRWRNEVICERCNKGWDGTGGGGTGRGRGRIICGCKKRLIAMVGCGGGQCNAVNAHGGCGRM